MTVAAAAKRHHSGQIFILPAANACAKSSTRLQTYNCIETHRSPLGDAVSNQEQKSYAGLSMHISRSMVDSRTGSASSKTRLTQVSRRGNVVQHKCRCKQSHSYHQYCSFQQGMTQAQPRNCKACVQDVIHLDFHYHASMGQACL